MTLVQRWLRKSAEESVVSERQMTRRAVLAAAMGTPVAWAASQPPRVAIVGGGVAGLYAAWLMKRSGLRATVYDAANRTGGRMMTATGAMGPGLTTELGGEFVDMIHPEILGLAKHFRLDLLDTFAPDEQKLHKEAFLFGGVLLEESEILRLFRKVAPQLERDLKAAETPAGVARFDKMSIDSYCKSIGADGHLAALLRVAFTTEYGMESSDQSAMNMLCLIQAKTADARVHLFGTSDERYKIAGGNQRVVDALAGELGGHIEMGHKLEAIGPNGEGYTLTFARGSGSPVDVAADIVLLALPFTMLRRVDLRVKLPVGKRRAIFELGYGMNAKLMMGVERRIWRDMGYGGNLFSDEPFQLAWDSSRRQAGPHGSVTMLCGGVEGIRLNEASAESRLREWSPLLGKAWKGIGDVRNGKSARFHWPSHPFTLGAYASYRVGQWSTIRGHEFRPVGRLHFAGEHTSADFQGYMEGGAETGKRAARAILGQAGMKAAFDL